MHLEYLRNMGVRASLSSALIRDGALWGLIACHDGRRLGRGLRELLGWMVQDLATQHVPTAADLAPTAAGLALFPLTGPPLVKLMWLRGEQVRRRDRAPRAL